MPYNVEEARWEYEKSNEVVVEVTNVTTYEDYVCITTTKGTLRTKLQYARNYLKNIYATEGHTATVRVTRDLDGIARWFYPASVRVR